MVISGNYMLRRPKRSMIEVVVPKEEEEMFQLLTSTRIAL
jgi:hypothetical protein